MNEINLDEWLKKNGEEFLNKFSGKTISAMESFTGGLFASSIISIPGASKFIKGSIIAYDSSIKTLFNVDISDGLISSKTALSMSKEIKKIMNSDISISFTGLAGTQNDPISLEKPSYIAINNEVFSLKLTGSRKNVREKAVIWALNHLFYTFF